MARVSFDQGTNPIRGAPLLRIHQLPEAPPPNIFTQGIRASS